MAYIHYCTMASRKTRRLGSVSLREEEVIDDEDAAFLFYGGKNMIRNLIGFAMDLAERGPSCDAPFPLPESLG